MLQSYFTASSKNILSYGMTNFGIPIPTTKCQATYIWIDHGGLDVIKSAMKKLEPRHSDHLKLYDPNGGKDNLKRLSGKHETSSVDKFTWGIADRSCSVRIPRQVGTDGKGYLEDRRPSSNCDPYVVTAAIASTILLE